MSRSDPAWHRTFSFQGFYDGAQHIVVLPSAEVNIDEVVAHETTHAKIASNSSLGYLQQITTHLAGQARVTGDRKLEKSCAEISEIVEKAGIEVHEASAWFVSEFVSEGRVRAPEQYAPLTNALRDALQAMPGHEHGRIEDWRDDFDPLFCAPVQIVQGLASYALSPPLVRDLLENPDAQIVDRLRNGLEDPDQHPLSRFRVLLKQVRNTPAPITKEWSRWVRSWYFKKTVPEKPRLSTTGLSPEDPQLEHSGFTRSDLSDATIAHLFDQITEGGAGPLEAVAREWGQIREYVAFEPHIHPYYQTCITETPRLERPYTYTAKEPFEDLSKVADYVIVSQGEEEEFVFRRGSPEELILRFGPMPNGTALFWRAERFRAREFLRRWSSTGKGIVTSSVLYDFGKGDLLGSSVVGDLPHAVVAITDFRTLWTKMTVLSDCGLAGATQLTIGAVQTGHPEFAFLVISGGVAYPVVVLPCLARLIQMLPSVDEELRIMPPYGVRFAQPQEMSSLMAGPVGAGVRAALAALSDHFDPVHSLPAAVPSKSELLWRMVGMQLRQMFQSWPGRRG